MLVSANVTCHLRYDTANGGCESNSTLRVLIKLPPEGQQFDWRGLVVERVDRTRAETRVRFSFRPHQISGKISRGALTLVHD